MPIKLKAEYANDIFGFNNCAKPLGERDDLHLLIIDAKATNNQNILKMFEELPSDKELTQAKTDAFLAKHKLPSTSPEASTQATTQLSTTVVTRKPSSKPVNPKPPITPEPNKVVNEGSTQPTTEP